MAYAIFCELGLTNPEDQIMRYGAPNDRIIVQEFYSDVTTVVLWMLRLRSDLDASQQNFGTGTKGLHEQCQKRAQGIIDKWEQLWERGSGRKALAPCILYSDNKKDKTKIVEILTRYITVRSERMQTRRVNDKRRSEEGGDASCLASTSFVDRKNATSVNQNSVNPKDYLVTEEDSEDEILLPLKRKPSEHNHGPHPTSEKLTTPKPAPMPMRPIKRPIKIRRTNAAESFAVRPKQDLTPPIVQMVPPSPNQTTLRVDMERHLVRVVGDCNPHFARGSTDTLNKTMGKLFDIYQQQTDANPAMASALERWWGMHNALQAFRKKTSYYGRRHEWTSHLLALPDYEDQDVARKARSALGDFLVEDGQLYEWVKNAVFHRHVTDAIWTLLGKTNGSEDLKVPLERYIDELLRWFGS